MVRPNSGKGVSALLASGLMTSGIGPVGGAFYKR